MAKGITKFPGVFIEEVKIFPPSIAAVETAVPVFIGYTEKDATDGEPKRISSILEYEQWFGKTAVKDVVVSVIDDKTDPVLIGLDEEALPQTLLYYSVKLFFMNGGRNCYVLSAGTGLSGFLKEDFLSALRKIEAFGACTLIVIPDAVKLNDEDFFAVCNQVLHQCQQLRDRFAVLDVKMQWKEFIDPIERFRSQLTNEVSELQFGAAYYPYLKTNFTYDFLDDRTSDADSELTLTELQATNEVRYFQIKKALASCFIVLPPSGAVAGVYARTDIERGVWKAPANLALVGILSATIPINNKEQERLNIDPINGKSINAIRFFTGKGNLVWGARTLAGNDNEWRYVSVRRLFLMVEESVKKSVALFSFEPNDASTWTKIRAMIENFLIQLWRNGALMGAKPEQAFYVRVGLGQTMTQADILNGNLIVEIGMAAVRPAEFIIIRIQQKMAKP